jgi:hypothetical protein
MTDVEEEYSKNETMKLEKAKKTDEGIEDLESLKKLEPMHKGSASIKSFLNKKVKSTGKK